MNNITIENLIKEISNKKDLLIITNNSLKNDLMLELSKLNKLLKLTIKSEDEVKSDIFEKYELSSRIELAKKQRISPSLADIKLKNALLVNENKITEASSDKFKDLYEIKTSYFREVDDLTLNYYASKEILIINDYQDDNIFNRAISLIKEITNKEITYYNVSSKKSKQIRILEFETLKEEVDNLVREVAILLEKGVSPENIKIHELSNDYHPYLKEAFKVTNIDIDLNENISLYETENSKAFLLKLKEYNNETIEKGFKYTLRDLRIEAINEVNKTLINVLNKYITIDNKIEEIYQDLIYTFKRTRVSNKKYDNVIKISNLLNSIINDEDHVFILGFNQDVIPVQVKDDDYLSDKEKASLNLLSSKNLNKIKKQRYIDFIESIKNLLISYPKLVSGIEANISSLYQLLKQNNDVEIEKHKYETNLSYSKNLSLLKLSKYLDNYYIYKETSNELFKLNSSFPDNNYRIYSNKFTGIDEEVLKNFLRKPLYLSYTTIDSYYNCSFVYYLEKVLRIRRSTNMDAIYIGNLFHDALYQLLSNKEVINLDLFFDKVIDDFLKTTNKEISPKDNFFIGIYKDILKMLNDFIKETEENSSFEVVGLEKEYQVNLRKLSPHDVDVDVVINGKIDKVLSYKFGTDDYAIVIDYKTGHVDFDLNRIIHGLNMQIIFYYYFLNSKDEVFKFGGGYLQRILPNSVFSNDDKLTVEEQFQKFFKLNGYSNSNSNILAKIDHNYQENSFLQGISVTKDGVLTSNASKKVISDEEFQGLLKVARLKINEAVEDIISGKFDINPKRLGSYDSCSFCPYQDICYKENSDYKELKEYKKFSFLEEEE